jgi:hypothetical protein
MTPGELLTVTSPTVQVLGGAWYFHPDTLAAGRQIGLDGFRFYFLGRGGVMGDVEAEVVRCAFGYFHPAVVDRMWRSGTARVPASVAARAHLECAHALGRAHLGAVDGLDAFCAAAEAIVAAADPAALALFAGYAAQPLPDDLPARTMQLLPTLRELRGSVHLVAVVASGLQPHQAHFLRRPTVYATFGWGEAPPDVGDEHRRRLDRADALTDELLTPWYAAVRPEQAEAMVTALRAIERALPAVESPVRG